MPRRAVLAIAVVVVVLAGAAAFAATRPATDARTLVSRVGGFSIERPAGWTGHVRRPTDEKHNEYARGHRPGLLGVGSTEGFYVTRFEASDFASLRRNVEKYSGKGAHLEEQAVAGYRAVVATARCRDSGLVNAVLRHHNRCRTVSLIAGRFVYQIGTWSWSGPPDETIATTFRAFAPSAWTAKVPGLNARLTLPPGWTPRDPGTAVRAVFVAFSPGDPVDMWVYVFRYPDASVDETIDSAAQNIARRGGHDIVRSAGTIAGHTRPRLDFVYPDGMPDLPDDHGVEWFLPDGRGGTIVLSFGWRVGRVEDAERIAATWRRR